MSYPVPEVGLVISYAYLWSNEATAGQVEGSKNRPCAIVMAVQESEELPQQIAVVPITHSPHANPDVSLEIPARVAAHLGLDGERSWVVLEDVNVFRWPGYDLRPIPGTEGKYDYGFLPPKFFNEIVGRIKMLRESDRVATTLRDV